jgi:hypothetical protein
MRGRGRLDLLKKLEIFGIRSRPTSFDVVNSELIQFMGNSDFVLHRKGNVFGLRSIPKGGIIDLNGIWETHRGGISLTAQNGQQSIINGKCKVQNEK